MLKKHIITIAGEIGSGKSSAAKSVAKKLGYDHYSGGDLMRQIGIEYGINDIREFNAFTLKEGSKVDFDRQVDERTKKIGDEDDRVVFDGHMAGYMLPQSFRVYLTLDPNVAVRRILAGISPDRRASEHIPDDPDEYLKMLKDRQQINIDRYVKLYDVDPYQPKLYDFVLDTEGQTVEKVTDIIIEAYEKWLESWPIADSQTA